MVIDWSNPVPPKPEPPPIRILKEGEVRKKCQTVYRVFVTNDAAKQIDHLPTSLRQLIKKRIDGLQNGDIQNSIGLPSTGDRSELRVFRVALGLHLLASIDKEEGVVAVVSVRNREDQWAHTEEYESLEDNKIGPLVGGIFLGFGIVAFFAIIFLLLH